MQGEESRAEGPALSIVIPAYDEAVRLPGALEGISEHWGPQRSQLEVVVVDDGSHDGTAEAARESAARLDLELRCLRHTPNRGKGYAVKRGVEEARGELVLVMDADLAVPLEYVKTLRDAMQPGVDVVIGSRRVPGAHIAVHQSRLREQLGSIFRVLASLLVVPGIRDFTCGFKLFRREAGRRIFALQRMPGWSYDVETLLVARRLGLVVREHPVEWHDDARTRVRLASDVVGSAWELARIRWNDLRGRYREPPMER